MEPLVALPVSFGGLWLAGWHLRHVDPAAVALSLRAVPWEEDGENGIAQVIDLTVDPAGLCAGPDDPEHLASAFVHLHEALIAALSRMSGLGPAAQWRLVADGLTAALLGRGKELGKAERAVALGSAILRDRRTKLGSRQGEFVLVDLPPDHAEWFRLRSGCCRYYTSEGGDYCTTCVHRNRDDQIHRLRAYLARRAAAA